MRVLLGLRDAQLGHAEVRNIFAERVRQALGLERHLNARDRDIVLRHADVVDVLLGALEAVELVVHERTGDLTRAVGAEVCKDDRVVVLDGRALGHDDRNNELVGHACVVGRLHGLVRGSRVLADALGDCVVRLLDALPALVAVHRVVTARDRRDAAQLEGVDLVLQTVDIFNAGLRRGVAAVHEAVEADLAQAVAARQFEQREHVVDVRMHAAVGQQTEDVQGGIEPLALVDRAHQRFVFEEITVLNGLGDAGQLLIHDAARADIGVTDLGVAHLTVRQADIQTGSADIGHRVFLKDLVQIRRVRRLDRIALLFIAMAEAVHNDQSRGLLGALLLGCGRFACGGLFRSSRLLCRRGLFRSGSLSCLWGRRLSGSRRRRLLFGRLVRHNFFFHKFNDSFTEADERGQRRFTDVPSRLNGAGIRPSPFPYLIDWLLRQWLRSQRSSGRRRRSGRRQHPAERAARLRS